MYGYCLLFHSTLLWRSLDAKILSVGLRRSLELLRLQRIVSWVLRTSGMSFFLDLLLNLHSWLSSSKMKHWILLQLWWWSSSSLLLGSRGLWPGKLIKGSIPVPWACPRTKLSGDVDASSRRYYWFQQHRMYFFLLRWFQCWLWELWSHSPGCFECSHLREGLVLCSSQFRSRCILVVICASDNWMSNKVQ